MVDGPEDFTGTLSWGAKSPESNEDFCRMALARSLASSPGSLWREEDAFVDVEGDLSFSCP
jgi:hypothetical protein